MRSQKIKGTVVARSEAAQVLLVMYGQKPAVTSRSSLRPPHKKPIPLIERCVVMPDNF